jgi:hypothetical protein
MENRAVENGVCSTESVNVSSDVWSCKNSDSSSADHLVIMVHGILGRYDFFFNFFSIFFSIITSYHDFFALFIEFFDLELVYFC